MFAAVLFVGSWLAGRLTRPEFVRLAGAASAGFAVPVLATVGWALAAGVRLHTLWYAVYGFRFDASRVLSDATDTAPTLRAGLLVLVALGAGMLLIIGGFVVHIRGEWDDDAPLTAAVAALLVVDVVGLASRAGASGATTCSRSSRAPRSAPRCWPGGRAVGGRAWRA